MDFNPDKCVVVHFGRSNRMKEYNIKGKTLGNVEDQKDLGVRVHRTLKAASQVEAVVKKAYGILAFINRGIEFRNREIMLQLYRTLVRPPPGVLCPVLVASLQKGCGSHRKGAEEIYKDVAWIR